MTGISTTGIHGANELSRVTDVAPPINVSTTFRYLDNPKEWVPADQIAEDFLLTAEPVYSRLAHSNSTQVESIIGKITGANAVVYNSGLSAIFAALTHLNPKQIAIGLAYHGTHGIANIFTRINGLKQLSIKDDLEKIGKGDIIYLETPVNPIGEVYDIQYYADKAHEKGAILIVDSTFAPPPLQDPFKFGADFVVHSATKFFGGHPDLLAGILLTKDKKAQVSLINDRVYLGTNIANLESFLLIRSLRTYELRILQQSKNATALVKYLNDNRDKFPVIKKITHGSLQTEDYVKKQHPNGHSPVFSIELDTEEHAKYLPTKSEYFHHATSLGGVESLIEWRAMSDADCSKTLLRVSVGAENIEDLIADFEQGLKF